MVNKHTIIVLVSIAVIVSSLGYSSLNLVSANGLKFKWASKSFDFTSVMYGGNLETCNNSDYPASFAKYEFTIFYDSKPLGKFTSSGISIPPHSKGIVNGKFTADDRQVAQIFFSFLDTEIQGTDVNRVDANKMRVTTSLDYTIIGVVPFSTIHEYSGQEFLDMMNENTKCNKMSDILVIQNARLEGPGTLGESFQSDGFHLDVVFAKKEKIPALDHTVVLVLGAPESANDNLEYLKNEMSLIRQASEKNIPVLGICLGSQLMAKAFGANVYAGPIKEIGFYDDIRVDSAPKLFEGINSPFSVFHWHGDTFDIPKNATRLAYSGLYNQAFHVDSAVGLQFHLEVTKQDITSWLENTTEDLSKIPYIDPIMIQNQIDQNLPLVQNNMKLFYRNFKSAFRL